MPRYAPNDAGSGVAPKGQNQRHGVVAGRTGRRTSSPPQLGQWPLRRVSAQFAQKVHSNEQMRASSAAGGSSRLQHSQLGRSWSMGFGLMRAAQRLDRQVSTVTMRAKRPSNTSSVRSMMSCAVKVWPEREWVIAKVSVASDTKSTA